MEWTRCPPFRAAPCSRTTSYHLEEIVGANYITLAQIPTELSSRQTATAEIIKESTFS